MFTGLIEDIGVLRASRRRGEDVELTVATAIPTAELSLGESIAVNGACLTVTQITDGTFSADASIETMRGTALSELKPGGQVHLERALPLGGRLGGHLVQGHVDGVGRVTRVAPLGKAWDVFIEPSAELLADLVPKGSIAVDGVSLTINSLTDTQFRLTIVPHTEHTTLLTRYPVGRRVNLETDIIGKYVKRYLGGHSSGMDDLLSRYGYT
jgi:riboflavin synthase